MDTYIYINKKDICCIISEFCKSEYYTYEFSEDYIKLSSENSCHTFSLEYKNENWIQPYDMDVDLCLYTDIVGKTDKTILQNGLDLIFALSNIILKSCNSDFMLLFEGEDCCIYRKNGFILVDPVLKNRYGSFLKTDSYFDFKYSLSNVYECVIRNNLDLSKLS